MSEPVRCELNQMIGDLFSRIEVMNAEYEDVLAAVAKVAIEVERYAQAQLANAERMKNLVAGITSAGHSAR